MTLSNFQLILTASLRMSMSMLGMLVTERDNIFPKPGELDIPSPSPNPANLTSGPFYSSPETILPLSIQSSQPKTSNAFGRPGQKRSLSMLPTLSLNLPNGRLDMNTTTESPTGKTSPTATLKPSPIYPAGLGVDSTGKRAPTASSNPYRASWHVVDLPPRKSDDTSSSSDADNDHLSSSAAVAGTPIAAKFLHRRSGSMGNLIASTGRPASKSSSGSGSGSAGSESTQHITSSTDNSDTISIMERTPTWRRDSPSPFFSSGAPVAALSQEKLGHKKRSSINSIRSLSGSMTSQPRRSSGNGDDTPTTERDSPPSSHPPDFRRSSGSFTQSASPHAFVLDVRHSAPEEEEELSSSDASTSVCSSSLSESSLSGASAMTAATPRDYSDSEDADIFPASPKLDERRTTITAETYVQLRANAQVHRSEDMKRKRGSMMILSTSEGFAQV